ncbi:MAG: hypothetical protein SFX18_14050 [Pirellulales bacterium]|nr:hypothetical protein [Pirellulales bacterium]
MDSPPPFYRRWMQPAHWAILWPGLPELWQGGDFSALIQAVIFSGLLNLCILSTWVWLDLLPGAAWIGAWLILTGFWIISCYSNARALQKLAYISSGETSANLFIQAQTEYLRGNWFEAENHVERLLQRRSNDVEARLLLVAIYRESGHFQAATQELAIVETLSDAAGWRFEILREKAYLQSLSVLPPTVANTPLASSDIPPNTPTIQPITASAA